MRQRQEQRALVVAGREQAVCATSKGSEWLNDAQQEVLAGAARRPTVVERVRIVGAVEDRIETYLAAREESLAATSTGSLLLRAEYGEGGSASSPQQSFAKREAAIARVAQQVDEELEAREETLRSMPLGRQYLSAAEQARAGGASGPPTPAERESMVRAAEQRVREELDRREERVLADTGDGRLLVDAAEELTESGAIIGDGGLTERTQIIGRAEGLLEEERAELKLKEADLLEDAAGEELLHKARLDVLGAADREAQTLADSWAVINQAAERKWEGQWTARVEALDNQLGGMDLYHAHLADIDPKWGADRNATTTRGNKDAALSAAESDGARLARLRGVLSAAAAARYREVLDDSPDRFNTTDLDRALAAGEREREEREAARLAAALETATAMAQAAAARSNVKLPDVRVIYETGETHAAGLAAVERTTQALDDAANQRLPADTVIHTWNANRSDPGGIAAALDAATAARREEERAAAAAARVERQLEALTARTGAARLAQRNGNSLRPVSEKIPPVRKLPRRVPDATREDAELVRALKDLENATEPGRLAQRNGNSLRPVEKSPPVPKPDRLVPDATREDAVAAAPLIVRARLPEAERQELRLGVDIAARELASEFGNCQWWSHADGELEELHSHEDRYLALNDTTKGPVEIGMLRTVLERDVYEKAFRLVEHPAAEPDPPTNLGELVRPFIRWLQDAVDRLIDRILDREPAHPPRPAAAADQVPARPALQPPGAPTDPALRQPVPPAAAASLIVEPPAAPATAPAPEPAALNVTEAERVRVAVDAVKAKLPRTQLYSGNPSHRPLAVSDERLDHLAAATDDEFVKTVVTELQRRQAYYTYERSESEQTYLRPAIRRKYDEDLVAYKEADAARGFFSRRPPKPTWAEAESVAIEEFEADQLVLIEGVCRDIQQWSPAAVRREFQRLEPKQERTLHRSRSSSHTKDRGDTSQSR